MARFKEKFTKKDIKRFTEILNKNEDEEKRFIEKIEQYDKETKRYTMTDEEKNILLNQLTTIFYDKNYKYVVLKNGVRVHTKKGKYTINYDVFYDRGTDTYTVYRIKFNLLEPYKINQEVYNNVYVENLKNIIGK